jgi:cell division protein FtsB
MAKQIVKGKEHWTLKRIIVVSILLILITANLAIAELTKQDLKEIEALLDKQEKRIKEYIDLKIDAVNSRIDAVEKTVNSRIDAVEKGQEFLKWMIGILAAVVVVGITLPPIWQERRERKASSFTQSVTAKLDSLIQRVAQLEQEIADLKRPKIYQHNPK